MHESSLALHDIIRGEYPQQLVYVLRSNTDRIVCHPFASRFVDDPQLYVSSQNQVQVSALLFLALILGLPYAQFSFLRLVGRTIMAEHTEE